MSIVDGHQFECSHAANGGHHHVFVLDSSGSMRGEPWRNLIDAVREYLANSVSLGASMDVVSIVTFDAEAEIACEAQDIVAMAANPLRIPFRGRGTMFSSGLRLAHEVLSRTDFSRYRPVLVFFSDGWPADEHESCQVARAIRRQFAKYELQSFVVGFGQVANDDKLARLARRLGGERRAALTGSEGKSTFFSISASLGTRAGLAFRR